MERGGQKVRSERTREQPATEPPPRDACELVATTKRDGSCMRANLQLRPTFELRRDRRQDGRPGPVKMYAYHRPGPGGLPLGLASNEGLGVNSLLR